MLCWLVPALSLSCRTCLERPSEVRSSSSYDPAPHRRIRVLIVDHHAAVRHAIATCITATNDLELVGEAAGCQEALVLCAQNRPDVILIAVTLPGASAPDATRAIVRRWPRIRIVGLSGFQDEVQASELLHAGAVTCLLKNVSAQELASTIRGAYAG